MNANQFDIARLLRANDGIIARRDCPQLQDSLAHLVSTGRLRTLLPGVYADPSRADQVLTRMRAAHLWSSDSILSHEAAARLTFWPELSVSDVRIALRSRRQGCNGFVVSRRRIPPELT